MRAALAMVCLLAAPAAAATVDWSAGSVSVRAVGVADLRLPSVAIARVAAERRARAHAESELRQAVRALPVAGGGTVGKAAGADAELGKTLDAVLASAEVQLDYQSDGSVIARASLPLARVSAMLHGAPAPPEDAAGDAATVVVVDSRKPKIAPAVGWRVSVGGTVRWVPFHFVEAGDARARPPSLQARATSVKHGVVALALEEPALARSKEIVVLVVTEGK